MSVTFVIASRRFTPMPGTGPITSLPMLDTLKEAFRFGPAPHVTASPPSHCFGDCSRHFLTTIVSSLVGCHSKDVRWVTVGLINVNRNVCIAFSLVMLIAAFGEAWLRQISNFCSRSTANHALLRNLHLLVWFTSDLFLLCRSLGGECTLYCYSIN